MGKQVAPWAAKANEVLIRRLFDGELLSGQAPGIDMLIDGVDVNAKLITKKQLQDNFNQGSIGKIEKSRQARGVQDDPPPFCRIAIVMSPAHPDQAGLYVMPGYSQGVYGAKKGASIKLCDMPTLQRSIANGTLDPEARKKWDSIDWKKEKQKMYMNEYQDKILSADSLDSSIEATEKRQGTEAAAKQATTATESLERTKAGRKAILNSKTVQKVKQARKQAEQRADQAEQRADQALETLRGVYALVKGKAREAIAAQIKALGGELP